MSKAHAKTVWLFEPERYPRSYETRMARYPLRRRAGLLLVAISLAGMIGSLLHGTPSLALAAFALLVIGMWLIVPRQQTIILYADHIKIRRGKVQEIRQRSELLGWKYAVESRHGAEDGKPCWILLVATDDNTTPLMLQSNRPELDEHFYAWVYSLPDLWAMSQAGRPKGAPVERVAGGTEKT